MSFQLNVMSLKISGAKPFHQKCQRVLENKNRNLKRTINDETKKKQQALTE